MWLEVEDRGPARWLIMNRPDRKNAVPSEGWEDLANAFADFEACPRHVLVIAGAGGAFCSGADLDPDARETGLGVNANRQRMARVATAALALHRITKPTIAAVDGIAAGAGMNLALGCDLVVASNRARFSEIFVRRGLTIDFGGTWLLPRIVGLQRAKEMALTGRIVDAVEAVAIGLALEMVDHRELAARVEVIVQDLAAGGPVAQMFIKQGINRAFEMSFHQAVADEGQSQSICLTSEDALEGVAAFVEKRPPVFEGH